MILDSNMQASQTMFDNMVNTLNEIVSSSSISQSGNINSPEIPQMQPNTTSPHSHPQKPPCSPYVRYSKDAVSDDMVESVSRWVADNQTNFVRIGDCRDTLYFGEYGYKYSGGKHDAKEMPAPLSELLEHIRPNMSDPTAKINSCLVTRYKTGADYIPAHRDDEPLFDPASEILTVSLGAGRVIKFADNNGTDIQELTLDNKSILVTSRIAQNFWKHGIEKTEGPCGERISFTFRHIAPHFLNSTIIIGDSNTTLLHFGDGKGKFGKWLPGQRIQATHIEDIPEPAKIGPHRNIVIHTGINNLKSRNSRSCQGLGNVLERKCLDIIKTYPNCKIHLSLALSTKLNSLNYRVKEYNNILCEISHIHKNISVIDHPFAQLCKNDGCLKEEYGRFDKTAGTPLLNDALHLGKKGLRVFAASIKTGILGRFRKQEQTGPGQPRVSIEQDNHGDSQSS